MFDRMPKMAGSHDVGNAHF